ncbi:MAG: hypothetical protein AB1752_03675 [Candidatus Zixiibacteriota bacterium]
MNATTRRSLSVMLAHAAALGLSCVKRAMGPPPEPINTPIHEPWEDEEAENIALLLSGHLCAPRDLYEQVRSDLAAIRESWGDTMPRVSTIRHHGFFIPGTLSLGVTPETLNQIQNGVYTAWDSLNQRFRLRETDISGYALVVHLTFEARVHWDTLSVAYADLPGLRWVEPQSYGGDWPELYVRRVDRGIGYLFSDAWGDCYAGCAYSHYWYYRVQGRCIEYVGNWFPQAEMPEPEPTWWEEASKSIIIY